MCRLFGFRARQKHVVHRSLVEESNALKVQSREHPHGWGIGYYGDDQAIHVRRGVGPAHEELDFARTSELVLSHCVIAHVRKASVGRVALENTHPFEYGPYLFAHNGTLEDFDPLIRPRLEAAIDPAFAPFVRGDTDSERCFYLFLTHLKERGALERASLDTLADAIAQTVHEVRRHADGASKPPSTNFLVSNGDAMVAVRAGRTLFLSTRSLRHRDRQLADQLGADREPQAPEGEASHLLIASEHLSDADAWEVIPENGLVGIDAEMKLKRWSLEDFGPRARRAAA